MLQYDVVYNHFPTLAANVESRADDLARQWAFEIQARAIVNTVRVDTGAMKNGWRVTHIGDGMYMIWNQQFYAVYHEYGTDRFPASPMLEPAVAEVGGKAVLLAAGFWNLS